ncbi:pyruvate dehydrogenase protein x component [Phyllosticta capitalensis]
MPALSPTMTEGNIASWKVKEGESFSAGDVLLEIETDKAQMDVEAQDDGILAKIIMGDGSKTIQVGQRIAVLAEPGDDLSTLEIPKEEATSAPQAAAPKQPEPAAQAPSAPQPNKSTAAPPGKAQKQTYPLYPSVLFTLRANGLSKEDADKIPATGPNGRLLKGDVLAYAGRLSDGAYASTLSKHLKEYNHLDLSNIKLAAPKKPEPKPAAPAKEEPVPEPETEIAVSINLEAVLKCQQRLKETLGTTLPLAEFIERAGELANEELPRSKNAQPTADELFNAVLGLDKIPTTSRGTFLPQTKALPAVPKAIKSPKQSDIIDILAGKPSKAAASKTVAAGVAGPINVFSLSVKKEEERRASVFLARFKTILETEPGQLIL